MSLRTSCLVLVLVVGILICEGKICYLSSCLSEGSVKWTLPKLDASDCTGVILGGHSSTCPEEDDILLFKRPILFSDGDDPQKHLQTTRITTATSSSDTLAEREETTHVAKQQTTYPMIQSTLSYPSTTLCPTNMEYGNCSCQATCGDPRNENGCTNICNGTETCACPDGFLMKGNECIREHMCGCFLEGEGVIKDGGFFVNADCSRTCSCSNNHLDCENFKCAVNATCLKIEGANQCKCNEEFVGNGQNCTLAAIDCLDLYNAGVTNDGVYKIYPSGWPGPGFKVYCEMESNNGGWTVFQRRLNGSVDFYRNWTSYKEGFGLLTYEFWLGNDKIHTLTSQREYQLRIDVVNALGTSLNSIYNSFNISDENDAYRLSVGDHHGNAGGNPLHLNMGGHFSTYDRDNDNTNAYNCAVEQRGAWWYTYFSNVHHHCYKWNTTNSWSYCSDSNLNGDYHKDGVESIYFWYARSFTPNECGITQTEMKIRPV